MSHRDPLADRDMLTTGREWEYRRALQYEGRRDLRAEKLG